MTNGLTCCSGTLGNFACIWSKPFSVNPPENRNIDKDFFYPCLYFKQFLKIKQHTSFFRTPFRQRNRITVITYSYSGRGLCNSRKYIERGFLGKIINLLQM